MWPGARRSPLGSAPGRPHAPAGGARDAFDDPRAASGVYLTADLPGVGGAIKQRPEDFLVEELPLYEPAGEGEHLYLFVEKRGLSTTELVGVVARAFGVRPGDIGYAGMKDKQAITRQLLSIHLPGKAGEAAPMPEINHERVGVLWADRHANKLRRGHLKGNRFSIKIRGVDIGKVRAATSALRRLAATGAPNRAGEQRFGAHQNNHRIGRLDLLGRTVLDVGSGTGLLAIAADVLGSAAAVRPNGLVDKIVTFGAALGITIPSFWLALILINQFAIQRRWFPAVGYVPITEDPVLWLKHLFLPALALSFSTMGELARYVRGAMSDSLSRDYVLAARAKGLRTPVVILKHALKNAMIPVITVIGVRFASILGGSVIIEQIFAIRGMGSLVINAVLTQDIPVVLGVAVLATAVVLVVNLFVDLSYGYFNPRLRHR